MDPSLKLIRDRAQVVRMWTIAILAMAVSIAAVLALSPASASDERLGKLVVAAMLVVAVLIIGKDALPAPESHPVVVALSNGGRDVVWIYLRRFSRAGSNSTTWTTSLLSLGLADGRRVSLKVPKSRDQEFVQAVAPLAPHATVGYDCVLEGKFIANPASLRRGS